MDAKVYRINKTAVFYPNGDPVNHSEISHVFQKHFGVGVHMCWPFPYPETGKYEVHTSDGQLFFVEYVGKINQHLFFMVCELKY